jgi:hypothetical protein
MKKSILAVSYALFSIFCFAQQPGSDKADFEKTTQQAVSTVDSIPIKLKQMQMDAERKRNERTLDAFIKEQQELKEKKKRRMYFQIGFGVLLLGVLVFGLKRKNNS